MCFQDPPDNETGLTRFVFQSNHFTPDKFKRKAFEPRNGEVSVFVISGLTDQEVWKIGFDYVGRLRSRPPECRGDFSAGVVRECGLDVKMETSKHERHANIVSWPEKEQEQLLVSLKLISAFSSKGIKPILPPTQ